MGVKNYAQQRYKVIDNLLTNSMRRYPTMEDIIEKCEERIDRRPSFETIQKDIATMKLPPPDGFYAPIKFNASQRGYEYTDPDFSIDKIGLNDHDIESLKEAIDLIKSIGGARVSTKFSHAVEKILSSYKERFPKSDYSRTIVQTDTPPTSRGFEHFDLFFKACKDRIPVSMVHYSYNNRRFKPLTIHPMILKEFDNKWYVVGYSELHDSLRTFGVDRIYAPQPIFKEFIKAQSSEIDTYLNDTYGVYPLENEKKQTIKIAASALATNYLEAYPIHESQHLEKHQRGNSTITFDLVPSMELISYFMSYGNEIRVIKPSWIASLIQEKTQVI